MGLVMPILALTTITARALGERIRKMRIRRNLTQQDLAGDDYSKSYISAIEQGKTRPSLEALQRIASRLQTAASTLLDPDQELAVPESDVPLPKRVRKRKGAVAGHVTNVLDEIEFELSKAEYATYTGAQREAVQTLEALLGHSAEGKQALLPTAYSARAFTILARANLRLGNISKARSDAEQGLGFAERSSDLEAAERARDLLGTINREAGQPLAALEYHQRCAENIANAQAIDPNLRIRIYSNLAADYRALYSNSRALEAYREAVEAINQVSSLKGQADMLWSAAEQLTSQGYAGNTAALKYAGKAVGLREALSNLRQAAALRCNLVNALLDAEQYKEAEAQIGPSIELCMRFDLRLEAAALLTSQARLYLIQDKKDAARESVDQAIVICRQSLEQDKDDEPMYSKQEVAEALALALALAGEIAYSQGQTTQSDMFFTEAIGFVDANPSADLTAEIYRRYAQALANSDRHEEASRYYNRAYNARTRR